MPAIGYIPYDASAASAEAGWVADALGCEVRVIRAPGSLNAGSFEHLPDPALLHAAIAPLLPLPWVIAEGPGGFVWAAILRAHGFAGGVTILPYLNPRRWYDVACAAVYRRSADVRDRIFLGSTPSARIYRALGVAARVGEPYGIDCRRFHPRADAGAVRDALGIPAGRMLLFAGRAQPDKDLYRLLRVGLRARLLFSDLQLVIASHVVDEAYVEVLRSQLGQEQVRLVIEPSREQLAALYCAADVFATAATSAFETFGRAPAEALACGTPAVAPRYDGFMEVLDQPGGALVDVKISADGTDRGDVHVDEERMLRAIYEVLSAPEPVAAERISAAAHARFCRSRTIRLLDHVVEPQQRSEPGGVPGSVPDMGNAELEVPAPWRDALAATGAMSAADALAWMWRASEHAGMDRHDRAWVAAVRAALCQPGGAAIDSTRGHAPCP